MDSFKRGSIIAFCGGDASGKTTIANELIKKLNKSILSPDKQWHYYKYPNRNTIIGKKIDSILKGELKVDKKLELKFFADNRKEDIKQILNIVKKGGNILLDRYVYCSMAYTFTNQVIDVLKFKQIELMTFNDIIKYDKNCIKPDFVYLIQGNFLNTRSTNEIYDMDNSDRDLLYNNYIIALLNSSSKFCIINNNNTVDKIVLNIIFHLNKFVINENNLKPVDRF